jgi:pimeloyl-ACP methyl ester carboxylesterase
MPPIASSLEQALLSRLAERTGKVVDIAYAGLVHSLGLTPRFFPHGFGDLKHIDMHAGVELFSSWPPPHFQDVTASLKWTKEKEGTISDTGYKIYRGEFRTPCQGSVYDALPPECRNVQALFIQPDHPSEGAPAVVHLAATGDHGFSRRAALSLPLVAQNGIASVILESPFYGQRKPQGQTGAKLHHVSDLLLLGRATIEEALFLLHWLSNSPQGGVHGSTKLGISGLSMGGVHASMVASLYPNPLALTPLLAPRSAAAAYCHGALHHATAWDDLSLDSENRRREIGEAIEAAARANERLAAARGRAAVAAEEAANDNKCEEEGRVGEVIIDVDRKEDDSNNFPTTSSWASIGDWTYRWGSSLTSQLRAVSKLDDLSRSTDSTKNREAAVALLAEVLETYTDVTRFPVPAKPEAAILVAATEDAYVSPASVLELQDHLPGSEVRWVPGGHVSSFLMHQNAFRQAIKDSLERL